MAYVLDPPGLAEDVAEIWLDVREATLAGIFLEKAALVRLTLAASGLEDSHPGADEIRQKLKRMRDIGFNEILLVSHHAVLEDIERAREML